MSLPGTRTLHVAVLLAVVLAACGAPTPTPTSERAINTTAIEPSPSVSSTPPASSAPTARPIPTPGYAPPSVATRLAIDGLAQVLGDRLRQLVDPSDHTAHPRQNRALNELANGDVVLLTDGPRSVGGRDFWEVFDGAQRLGTEQPLGWVSAERDGAATLTPFQPDCPPTLPTTAAELLQAQHSSDFAGFACFGPREIVLNGRVHCNEVISDGVLGSPFFDAHRSCTLDGVYVYGKPVFDLLPDESGAPHFEIEGLYDVRGQFDHPESAQCSWIPFGTDIGGPGPVPDPGAVASCRRVFVVTAVREL